MTAQQPRTPTTEMNNRESATVTYETHRRVLTEARADLLAQIEKALDLDAIRQEVVEAADEAAAQYDEDGYPPEAIADAVYEILRVRLAAIRSAAPVEPESVE